MLDSLGDGGTDLDQQPAARVYSLDGLVYQALDDSVPKSPPASARWGSNWRT